MTEPNPPEFDTRDQALADGLKRYVTSLESGASRQTAQTVLSWWVEWASTHGYDDLTVLDDDDEGVQALRRTAQELRSRVEDPDDTLSSPSSARTYWNILSAALSYLVDDQLLSHYPARANAARAPLPTDPGTPDTQQFWTADQRDTLITFVDDRAYQSIESDDLDHTKPVRDRALVALIAWTGVRGAEILRSRHDDREGRNGLRWSRLNLEEWTLTVRGKSNEWEPVGIPPQARSAIERWYSVLQPDSAWPVIPTLHRPTLAKTATDALESTNRDVEDVRTEGQSWLALLRELEVTPPAMTVDGGRSLVERLAEEADVENNGEPLRLHGARRGLGRELYQHSAELAQTQLRHQSIKTTKQSYHHVDAAVQGGVVGDLLADEGESSPRS
jgi:integrase